MKDFYLDPLVKLVKKFVQQTFNPKHLLVISLDIS